MFSCRTENVTFKVSWIIKLVPFYETLKLDKVHTYITLFDNAGENFCNFTADVDLPKLIKSKII